MDFFNQIPEILSNLQNSVPFYSIVFYFFAAIIVASGLMTIFSKKLMHSAVALLFAFFGVAGLYAMLAADFIAVTQIMVYIGGILTLIIFGVMLTTRIIDVDIKSGSLRKVSLVVGSAVAVLSGAFLAYMFVNTEWKQAPVDKLPDGTINQIGNLLLTNYLGAFIAAAVLLLVAFIGAALIARRRN